MGVTRTQRLLIALSACLMIAALVIKRAPLGQTTLTVIGAVEVLVAIAIGVAFGLAATRIAR